MRQITYVKHDYIDFFNEIKTIPCSHQYLPKDYGNLDLIHRLDIKLEDPVKDREH